MITIQLDNISINVVEVQDQQGNKVKVVTYVDQQSGIRVVVPHDGNSARTVAAALEGRPVIQVANGMPPNGLA